MKIPVKARITLLIVAGVGFGMAAMTYGLMLTDKSNSQDASTYVSVGAGILSATQRR